MAENEPMVGGAGAQDQDDPVSAVRTWLVRQGLPVPPPDRPVGQAGRSVQIGVAAGRRVDPGEAVEAADFTARADADTRPQPVVEVQLERQARSGRSRRSDPSGPAPESDEAAANPESVARTIVLRKLSAQARTRHELAKALAARQVPDEVAQDVLDRFQQVGLVDDVTFARDWVESRQQRRHLSTSALRRELQTKGVDRDTIDDAVGQVAGEDELVAAQALAEKKFRSMSGLPREVQYRRLAGALARRGFSGGISAAVIGPLLDASREA